MITVNTKWKQSGITVAGGYEYGDLPYHLPTPAGVYIDDDDQSIYITEWGNHRVVQWKYNSEDGEVVAGDNGQGSGLDQFNWPTDVVINKSNDSLIVCDQQNRRIVRWPRRNARHGYIVIQSIGCEGLFMNTNGDLYFSNIGRNAVERWKQGLRAIVAGGNGKGNNSNQLNFPSYIFVDRNNSVYVSERLNHRVTKWFEGAREGIVVAGGHGQGNDLAQLNNPRGVIVDDLESVYVADSNNHRIIRWLKGATKGSIVVGGRGEGNQLNQFKRPIDIVFDRKYSLYVTDHGNHRLQRFDVDPD